MRGTGCQGITDSDRMVFVCRHLHAGPVCLYAEGFSGQLPLVFSDLIRLQSGAADFEEQCDIPADAVFNGYLRTVFRDMSVKEHGVQMGHGPVAQRAEQADGADPLRRLPEEDEGPV